MARSYKRDSSGRFSSTGGGGRSGRKTTGPVGRVPQSKAATSRATNTARAAQLRAGGTTAIGGRVKAKGFAGGAAAQQRAGGLRKAGQMSLKRPGVAAGAGTRSAMKASAAAASKARSRAASKGATKMSKAPVSAAKARYKELSSAARRSGAFRTAAENRAAAGAKRSLKSMVEKRGTAGKKRKAKA